MEFQENIIYTCEQLTMLLKTKHITNDVRECGSVLPAS